ncbi:MAG: RQC domain protein [Proteobacteria bacterium]|nr:RQC domain protein [Pseudomonadota bacterium]
MPRILAMTGVDMGRKVRQVPVTLNARGVQQLSDAEICVMLRGADELVGSGGRTLLAKVLKGSKQKVIFDKELQQSPVYGALGELSIADITARIDWLIIHRYLAIEYDYRLPLLVYTSLGWAIERETYADELLARLDRCMEDDNADHDLSWLTEKNPRVLELVLERIAESGNRKYLPALARWRKLSSKRFGRRIGQAVRALTQGGA